LPSASATTSTPLPDQEMHGTPADCAMMVEAILSPSRNIEVSFGPMNVMPISSSVRGSAGASEAWPQPGQTASASKSCATEMMTLTLA